MSAALVSRQPSCPECRHEFHMLPCDWCLCDHSTVVGVYP